MTGRTRISAGLAALALALTAVVGASAHDGKGKNDGGGGDHGGAVFAATLAPSQTTDPAIHGVAPGGLPWVLDRGSVRIGSDGRFRADIRGLVIPVAHGTFPAGTAQPVTTVSASLYCGVDTTAAATTSSVPISADGDARIDETVALPATCLGPVVLVHPNGGAGAYIAASGWR